jgi:hypothetical protein
MDPLFSWVLDQGPRKLLRRQGFKRPGGGGAYKRTRGFMRDELFIRDCSPRSATARVVEVYAWQWWHGLFQGERTFPLLLLDPQSGDREDFAIGLLSLLEREVLPGFGDEVDVPAMEALARRLESRGLLGDAATCWGWLGNAAEVARVEALAQS